MQKASHSEKFDDAMLKKDVGVFRISNLHDVAEFDSIILVAVGEVEYVREKGLGFEYS